MPARLFLNIYALPALPALLLGSLRGTGYDQ